MADFKVNVEVEGQQVQYSEVYAGYAVSACVKLASFINDVQAVKEGRLPEYVSSKEFTESSLRKRAEVVLFELENAKKYVRDMLDPNMR